MEEVLDSSSKSIRGSIERVNQYANTPHKEQKLMRPWSVILVFISRYKNSSDCLNALQACFLPHLPRFLFKLPKSDDRQIRLYSPLRS